MKASKKEIIFDLVIALAWVAVLIFSIMDSVKSGEAFCGWHIPMLIFAFLNRPLCYFIGYREEMPKLFSLIPGVPAIGAIIAYFFGLFRLDAASQNKLGIAATVIVFLWLLANVIYAAKMKKAGEDNDEK